MSTLAPEEVCTGMGASPHESGVAFRVWAPRADHVRHVQRRRLQQAKSAFQVRRLIGLDEIAWFHKNSVVRAGGAVLLRTV